jgi:hypothetical protein
MQLIAERAGAFEIVAEGLLNDDATPAVTLGESGGADALGGGSILAGLRGEIEQNVAAGVARLFDFVQAGGELLVRLGVVHVAGHVEEALREAGPDVVIEGGILQEFADGFAHLLAKLVVGHGGAGDADDGESGREPALIHEAIEGGQELALGEVAIGAVDDDGALGDATLETERVLEGVRQSHVSSKYHGGCTRI